MKTYQKLCDGKFSVEMEVTGKGEPLLFLHGAGGLLGLDPFLEELGAQLQGYTRRICRASANRPAANISTTLSTRRCFTMS